MTPSKPSRVSTPIDDLFAEHGLKRRVVVTLPHFLVAPFVVASSDLAWIAPTRMIRFFDRALALRSIELPFVVYDYGIGQAWAARRDDEPAIVWLREAVASTLSSSQLAHPPAKNRKPPAKARQLLRPARSSRR